MADLREILTQATAGLAKSLGELINEQVAAELSDLQGGAVAELGAAVTEEGVAISLAASGAIDGAMLLWLPEGSAKGVAGALAGEEATAEALSDLHVSALGELGKLTAEALSNSLNAVVKGVQISAGEPERVAAGGLAGSLAGLGEEANLGVSKITIKGTQLPVQLYLASSLAAAISTVAAQSAPAEAAPVATEDFQPGLGSPQAGEAGQAEVKPVELSEAAPGQVLDMKTGLELLGDVNVDITVELGRTNNYVREVLNFSPGSIIELDKLEGEPVDVCVNGMLFARGEVVTIDENFAVRITEIMSKEQRYGGLQSVTK